jgi:ATP-dependent RNA helicase HelY
MRYKGGVALAALVGEPFGDNAVRRQFVAGLSFELDSFQLDALDALDGGQSVVVAAPTGSGKTVVAEYAVARALAGGGKAFYTTPLKALSNQKYADLVRRYGPDQVGLLTGDNVINGTAPVVVMTTEVLRNMIYARSGALEGLRYVVLDEVHYLQNAYRGPVWEEVIIHTPPEVDLVCLSATVSNAEELADWIRTVRGATTAVIEDRRPVELHDLYLVGDRRAERVFLLPTLVEGSPNPEVAALTGERITRQQSWPAKRRSALFAPRRVETVEMLEDQRMLPAIYFIFSRAACDEAVSQCLREGRRLTTSDERRQVRAIAETSVSALNEDDLRVLGYQTWLNGMEAGYAAHHAGLVPPFKEAVERCFAAGLVKVVFATETLSLGINMPARSVVIEKLTKFTGERHEMLTPGEYTQLTGRAGRRGIDDVGFAIVNYSPFVPFEQVAGLAGARTYALSSSFRPTYNMAANLVRRYPPDQAHHLLNLSFAQYRADSDIVRLETLLARAQEALGEAEAAARCERGDVDMYRTLLRAGEEAAHVQPTDVADILAALEKVRPGDVLVVPGGKWGGKVAVVSKSSRRGGDVRLRAINSERRMLSLSARDFPLPPQPLARIELPTPFAPNSHSYQRRVASALIAARVSGPAVGPSEVLAERRMEEAALAADHPVAACPEARTHLRALDRAQRLRRDVDRLSRSIRGRSESLARQFDRVLQVLERRGYVRGWALTDGGQLLSRLYHEQDLLIAECVERGVFHSLKPAEMAGLASVFTYEARGSADPVVVFPSRRLRDRWGRVETAASQLASEEEAHGLPGTRAPDPGFVALAHAWAAGEPLSEVVAESEMSGGDFVRNIKQLIDLLRQLGDLLPDPAEAASARSAAEAIFRGVVAASTVVSGVKPKES